MYPNVKAEFARKNLNLSTVADKMGISVSTLSVKMRNGGFTLNEAKQIKEILETDISIEELFKEAEQCK